MEDPSHRRHHKKTHCHRPSTIATPTTGEPVDEVKEAEEGDPQVWATFNNSFRQVQSVLDRNRLLIQQVNENQQSRIPDNMAKNVSLIQELNGNISKVAHIYSDLNSEFTTMYHKRSTNSASRRDK
ncbi:protein EARLY FLOWERING 4-like [Prosopis cineraria]|uniref:protein EARLY FLOWERING 4-like n=1 Tax=Prosopis cineraria TaxID=364024 RepID=UPI00240F300D|nr:protein EARLY FLOWERING 4-like [Prosopis cineraria]